MEDPAGVWVEGISRAAAAADGATEGFIDFDAGLAPAAVFGVVAALRAGGFFAVFFPEGAARDFFSLLPDLSPSFRALSGVLRDVAGAGFGEAAGFPGPTAVFFTEAGADADFSGLAMGFSIERLEAAWFGAVDLEAGTGFDTPLSFASTGFSPSVVGFCGDLDAQGLFEVVGPEAGAGVALPVAIFGEEVTPFPFPPDFVSGGAPDLATPPVFLVLVSSFLCFAIWCDLSWSKIQPTV